MGNAKASGALNRPGPDRLHRGEALTPPAASHSGSRSALALGQLVLALVLQPFLLCRRLLLGGHKFGAPHFLQSARSPPSPTGKSPSPEATKLDATERDERDATELDATELDATGGATGPNATGPDAARPDAPRPAGMPEAAGPEAPMLDVAAETNNQQQVTHESEEDDDDVFGSGYDPAVWKARPFPTTRPAMINELKVAQKQN
jgi:hypothetical protein